MAEDFVFNSVGVIVIMMMIPLLKFVHADIVIIQLLSEEIQIVIFIVREIALIIVI
jgi:hypothetical protein